MSAPCDTSSSSHPLHHQSPTRCLCDPRHELDDRIDRYRHHQRRRRRRLLLPHRRYDLRQTVCYTLVDLLVILLLVMTSASFLSSGRPVVWVTASAVPAGAASPTASPSTGPLLGPPLTSRSTGLDSPLFSSGYPFIGERRLSSRTVTTKYGSLRGVTLTLPNRGLQSIEVFLGKESLSPAPRQ